MFQYYCAESEGVSNQSQLCSIESTQKHFISIFARGSSTKSLNNHQHRTMNRPRSSRKGFSPIHAHFPASPNISSAGSNPLFQRRIATIALSPEAVFHLTLKIQTITTARVVQIIPQKLMFVQPRVGIFTNLQMPL